MNLRILPALSFSALSLAFCLTFFVPVVSASPLSDARDAGLVKELTSGFIASTEAGAASAEITNLVKDINTKRSGAYQKIAKKNGVSVEQVGQESYLKRHPQ